MAMQASSRTDLNLAVNSFLLCSILSKQARRLGKLLPDRRIAELITVAMKNCADYEIVLELGPDVPHVVRTEAMQIGRLARRVELSIASGLEPSEGSGVTDVAANIGESVGRRERTAEALPGDRANGPHISLDSTVDSLNSRRNLFGIPRTLLMSRSNGIDPTRLRQLRAITDNLCTLANRHRENKNYVVAHALYGRALAVAQEIHTPDDDGSSLMARIRKDQQTVFDLMRSGEGSEKPPLEKAKEVGR
jgi:hypothetical protein